MYTLEDIEKIKDLANAIRDEELAGLDANLRPLSAGDIRCVTRAIEQHHYGVEPKPIEQFERPVEWDKCPVCGERTMLTRNRRLHTHGWKGKKKQNRTASCKGSGMKV
jgi:hypothetical protein